MGRKHAHLVEQVKSHNAVSLPSLDSQPIILKVYSGATEVHKPSVLAAQFCHEF
jgi:hypothetical protein